MRRPVCGGRDAQDHDVRAVDATTAKRVATDEPTPITPGSPREAGYVEVNRVAETQFFIRPQLERALKQFTFTDAGQETWNLHSDVTTYFDYWKLSRGFEFFDMATLIRLGTAVQMGLGLHAKAVCSPEEYQHFASNPNIFQQLVDSLQFPEMVAAKTVAGWLAFPAANLAGSLKYSVRSVRRPSVTRGVAARPTAAQETQCAPYSIGLQRIWVH